MTDGFRPRSSWRRSRPASRRPAMTSSWPGRRPRRPSACWCATTRRPAEFRSRRRTIRPTYNGLKFFQRAGMVLSQTQGAALLDRWQRRDFRWASWDSLGRARRLEDPDQTHLERVLVDRRRRPRSGAGVSRSCSTLATVPAGGWGRPCSVPSAAGPSFWEVSPTAATTIRPNRPRPT